MTQNFQEIIQNYDALIVDLWGVIHDGSALYPGAADTLRVLHELRKPVLFLSNAPRVSAKARENLTRLNIPPAHYLEVVTSGQVAHDLLNRMEGGLTPPSTPAASDSASPTHRQKTHYYYLGPSKDEDILADLPHYAKAEEPHAASLILCTGYEYDGQPHEEIVPLLMQLLPLPMLCVNPDMEVVKQDGTQWLCAGAVAAEYTKLGGKVAYIGKPFREVYDVCKLILGQARVLCVGDNPATDIKGANDAGMDSLLITGGVLAARYGDELNEESAREICRIAGVKPTYVLSSFSL